MTIKLNDWDASQHLDSPDVIQEYIQAALDTGDPALLREALSDAAKAKGMAYIAQKAHLNRQSLYKSLSSTGNPSYETILKIVKALGLKLTVSTQH